MTIDEYRKAYQKEYREKNQEKKKAYFRDWYAKNKDRTKEYYRQNADKIKAQHRARYKHGEAERLAFNAWLESKPEEYKEQRRAKRNERQRQRYKADRDFKAQYKQQQKEWRQQFRKKHPELASQRDRRDNLRRFHAMTLEEYDALYEAQKGCCAICNKFHEKGRGRKNLAADHCHQSNRVRGLLCSNCNTAIGLLYDRIDLLESAIKYLAKEPIS